MLTEYLLSFTGWKFWVVVFVIVVVVIWIVDGGQNRTFEGLNHVYERLYGRPSTVPPAASTPTPPVEVETAPPPPAVPTITPSESAMRGPIYSSTGGHYEAEVRRTLEEHYGVPFPTVRPGFLRNLRTHANLELDCYNWDLLIETDTPQGPRVVRIAAEYQSEEHYHFPNRYHRDRSGNPDIAQFRRRLRYDQIKLARCENHNVYLIRVPYGERDRISDYVRARLPTGRVVRDGRAMSSS